MAPGLGEGDPLPTLLLLLPVEACEMAEETMDPDEEAAAKAITDNGGDGRGPGVDGCCRIDGDGLGLKGSVMLSLFNQPIQ